MGRGKFEDADVARLLIRLGTGVFLAMNIMLFSLLNYSGVLDKYDLVLNFRINILMTLLATPLVVILGGPFIKSAIHAALRGRVNGDALVSIGITAAYGYSLVVTIQGQLTVYYDTVAMVLLLFTLGRLLEAIGKAKAVRSLEPMFAAENATAVIVEENIEERRPVNRITAGDVVLIQPGELVPTDGIVVEGNSDCEESLLTGEPLAVAKRKGDRVFAGSINVSGRLLVQTEHAGVDSRWGNICQRVRSAIASESDIQRALDRVADFFVPFVLLLALASTVYWSGRIALPDALMIGLSVLVVACPCALGLAAPLAGTLGLKKAAYHGLLIRSSGVLEMASAISRVAMDKTGTLTEGKGRLVRIFTTGCDENELIRNAASVEKGVHQPLARAICDAALARQLDLLPTTNLREIPGMGVMASSEIGDLAVGNEELFANREWMIDTDLAAEVEISHKDMLSLVWVGWNGSVHGALGIADTVLPEAKKALAALRELGMETCVLSGDSQKVTESVANEVGADHWRAELTPEAKQAFLKEWLKPDIHVAMVGDGLNDAPVLAQAAVGIAVGSAADLARETADIVLTKNGLASLPWLFSLSRRVHKTIYQNLAWALSYNAIGLFLAAVGLLQPVAAAALMAGSSLIIVVNSLRLDRFAYPAAATPAE